MGFLRTIFCLDKVAARCEECNMVVSKTSPHTVQYGDLWFCCSEEFDAYWLRRRQRKAA